MSKLTQLIFALFAFMQCCMVSASSVSLKQVELRVNGTDGTTLQLSDIDPTYGDELNVPVSLFDSLQLSFVSAGPLDQVHLLVGAVSYTHLDVYKRQPTNRERELGLDRRETG